MTGGVVCPRCSTVNGAAARFCSNCGLERPVAPVAQSVSPSARTWTPPAKAAPAKAPPSGIRLALGAVGIFVVLVVVGGLIRGRNDNSNPSGGGGAQPTRAPAVTWTAPAGFSKFSGDPTVAYRWDDRGSCTFDSCWHMTVVTKDGCPTSLYVELTTLTPSGTVVGYTNDTVGAVRAGEQAKLNFENLDEGASKARIAEVACY